MKIHSTIQINFIVRLRRYTSLVIIIIHGTFEEQRKLLRENVRVGIAQKLL